MNNSVRNEAQRVGIAAIAVAIAVLVVFFFISRSGLGSPGETSPGATGGSTMQSSGAAPSPAAT